MRAAVTIDNEIVGGSPVLIRLKSTIPELNKTVLDGSGLKAGVVGTPSAVRVSLVDVHGNPCRPGPAFHMGIALSPELKKRVLDVRETEMIDAHWLDDDSGTFVFSYVPIQSGVNELHVW